MVKEAETQNTSEVAPEPSHFTTPPRWSEKLKLHKWKILGGVLGIFVLAGAVFGAYKLGQLSRPKTKAVEISCQEDSDCVLVIDKGGCCSCPTAVNKSELDRNKNLRIFLPEEMEEAQEVRPECKNIICSPCAFWNKAVCVSGVCRGAYEESESPTADWKTYTNKEHGFSIKYPSFGKQVLLDTDGAYLGICNLNNALLAIKASPPDYEQLIITVDVELNNANLDIQNWLTANCKGDWVLNPSSKKEIIIGGVSATKITGESKFPPHLGSSTFAVLSREKMLYFIHLWYPSMQFERGGEAPQIDIYETTDQILSTFRFLEEENPRSDCLGSCKCMKECNKEGPVYFIHDGEGAFECSINSVDKTCCCSGV